MNTKVKKRRIETIDIAKAITIFLVILGHSTGNLDAPMFLRMLYAFHVPLFFALAGMSMTPKPIYTSKESRSEYVFGNGDYRNLYYVVCECLFVHGD